MQRLLFTLLVLAVCSGTAVAARLPGVKTPSRNISCFYVPQRPTAHGNLICNIKQATYAKTLQAKCIAPPSGLDWHGFTLSDTKSGAVLCTGGLMYDAHDTPTYVTLAYGKSWHYRGLTCTSRVAGLTCTNRFGHGVSLSRASWRAW